MNKDAYYFSHDSNARHDRKIISLKRNYGLEGYGRFWVIVEILREQSTFKLELDDLTFEMLAVEFGIDILEATKFIRECCDKYKLFETDGESFWSESLINRMTIMQKAREKKIEAGKRSAEARQRKKESQ